MRDTAAGVAGKGKATAGSRTAKSKSVCLVSCQVAVGGVFVRDVFADADAGAVADADATL